MNERQLESFVSAADQKSFSKAAKMNYISVQALIQQIDILEDSLGFELFIRTRRGVYLTPGGEIFYDTAKQILDLYYNSIENAKKESLSNLRIAVPEEQYPDFLLNVCKEFTKSNPETNISFVSAPMTEHFQLIKTHKADCSFLGEPDATSLIDLIYEPLEEDTYSFAMNPTHELAKKDHLTSSDLENLSVFCGYYPFMKHTFLDGLSHTNAKLIDIKKEYDFSIKSQILFSDNLLVFPSSWRSFYERSLTVIPSNIPSGSIGILYRRRAKKSMESFLSFLKEIHKEMKK